MPIIPLLLAQNAKTFARHCHNLMSSVTKGFIHEKGTAINGGLFKVNF
jgi:hypothetical protein